MKSSLLPIDGCMSCGLIVIAQSTRSLSERHASPLVFPHRETSIGEVSMSNIPNKYSNYFVFKWASKKCSPSSCHVTYEIGYRRTKYLRMSLRRQCNDRLSWPPSLAAGSPALQVPNPIIVLIDCWGKKEWVLYFVLSTQHWGFLSQKTSVLTHLTRLGHCRIDYYYLVDTT